MALWRGGLVIALALGMCGCDIGAPDRASDIQNPHAISDDIAAGTMTESSSMWVHDPNLRSTFPNSYSTEYMP